LLDLTTRIYRISPKGSILYKLVLETISEVDKVRKVSNPACRTARSSVKVEFITDDVVFRYIHEMKKVVRGTISAKNEVDD